MLEYFEERIDSVIDSILNGNLPFEDRMDYLYNKKFCLDNVRHSIEVGNYEDALDRLGGFMASLGLDKIDEKMLIEVKTFLEELSELPSDQEIVESYGQIWDNVKHMTRMIVSLKERYIEENFQ